jgi:phosphohistidine phosphatase
MGVYIRESGLVPELVLCSSATRACQTLDLLRLHADIEVLVEDALYAASAASLIARLRNLSDATRSVLLIGHNPSIQDAAISLARNPDAVEDKFPTAALAEFLLPVPWQDLGPGVAELRALTAPRSLD